MDQKLKILHLEDVPSDAELVERELKKSDIDFEKVLVDNRKDFIHALQEFRPDIILSDHSLPSLDSQEALQIVKKLGIKVPFILVTATVSEEYAVNIMKEGAFDYILKDRLQRLPNAVLGAMNNYRLSMERAKADEVLRASEQKYKLLFESNPMPMLMISESRQQIIDVNRAAVSHYGYTREEFLKLPLRNLMVGERNRPSAFGGVWHGFNKTGVWQYKKKNGSIITVDILAHEVIYNEEQAILLLANDITEKLKAEAELKEQQIKQQKLITETSIQVQEREREEIGRELHDNINQILAATKMYLEVAIRDKEESLDELLEKSFKNISLAIEEIRQFSRKLVAPSLSDITLGQAVMELIRDLKIASKMNWRFNMVNFDEDSVNENIKLMFYRIIQEQVNNILKYSRAKNATIQLEGIGIQILLTIADDGIGFDPEKTSGGIGLRNIKNRAGFYNGNTQIISSYGKGCRLEVSVPIAD